MPAGKNSETQPRGHLGLPKRDVLALPWVERVRRLIAGVLEESAGRGTKAEHEALYEALGLAYSFVRKVAKDPVLAYAVNRTCKKRGIPQPRYGSNRFLRCAKLLFPMRHERDQHRYAKLWLHGLTHGWKRQDLLASLKHAGGLAKVVNSSRKLADRQHTKRTLFELGQEDLANLEPIGKVETGHIEEARRDLIMLGRQEVDGTLVVSYLLTDCPGLWKQAVIEVGRRRRPEPRTDP